MSETYYKGKIGVEDIQFGTSTFLRKDKNYADRELNQINLGDIPRKVITKDDDYTIPNSLIGEITFTNEDATGTITFTLPPATAGLGPYFFTVIEAYDLRVDPNGTDLFRDCAAGKYKYSYFAGNRIKVWCDVAGTWEWDYEVVQGVWDNEA